MHMLHFFSSNFTRFTFFWVCVCALQPHLRDLVLELLGHGLQLLRPLLAQRLRGKVEVVGLRQRPQVEVVLGVHARGDVDVELEHLQELTLKLVPGRVGSFFQIKVPIP